MTRKEALTELIAKVEAGETSDQHLIDAAFPEFADVIYPWSISRVISWIMLGDMRAMGAAKALHEAVLPGWTPGMQQQDNKRWFVELREGFCTSYSQVQIACVQDPARAWLLAILRALHDQDDTTQKQCTGCR